MFNSIQTKEDYKLFVRTNRCSYANRDCKKCVWRFKHYTPGYISECFFDYDLKGFKYLVHYDVACNMIDQAFAILRYLVKHKKKLYNYHLSCNEQCYIQAEKYLRKFLPEDCTSLKTMVKFDNDVKYGLVRLRKNK